MSVRPELSIQERQLRQLSLLDFALMFHHLLNIPVRAHEASLQEIRSFSIEPERQSPGESLRVFGEGREGVDDHPSVVGCDDTGVEREGSEGWVLCDVTSKGMLEMSANCDRREKNRVTGKRIDTK